MSAFSTKIARLKFRQKSRSKSDGESPSGVASSASFEKRSLLGSISERAPALLPDLPELRTDDNVLLAPSVTAWFRRRKLDAEPHPPSTQAEKTTYLYPQDIDPHSLSDDSSCSSSDDDDDDGTDGGNCWLRPRHDLSPGEKREDGRVHRIGGAPFRDMRSLPWRIRDTASLSPVKSAKLRNTRLDAAPKHRAPDAVLVDDDNTLVDPFRDTRDRATARTNSHDIHNINVVFRRLSTVSEGDLGCNRHSARRTPSMSDLTEEVFGTHRRSYSESSDESDEGILPHLLSFDDDNMGPCHNNCGFRRSASFS
eukprot:CAMPEP_0194276086 /NCGR_PEP_ID=MMETSP0169-20130528/8769_1 /TAXON_ID=218684 /ORGANISM="Corethron pennatum, Strain L29A3" /LENGTH=309 /DNA_ID=CAMNT_0039019715 /DNA_START=54 /DNA_END=983 /DNA_ORIENTATION=+